jgi:hypothetical protein
MSYKLAFVTSYGEATRLWMCDAKSGARSVLLNSYDEAVSALLGQEWEPFGIATDGALWFRKADNADAWAGEGNRPELSMVEPLESSFAPA